MHKVSCSLIMILLILTVSCGKDSGNKRETRIEETQMPEVMNRQEFECASLGGSCPEGVSRLLIVNPEAPERSAVCSGFMVGPDRLVTNNHCVSTAGQCRSTFIAVYNGGSYLNTRCKTILQTATDGPDANDPNRKLDYTVIQTADAFTGDVFSLSNTLARPGEKLSAWVVDHTGLDAFPLNLTDSRITEFECTVMDQDERAALMMMKCPIISGNSGSPVVNNQGQVVGVIWGGSANTIDSSIDLDIRRELNEVGLATEVNYFREAVLR